MGHGGQLGLVRGRLLSTRGPDGRPRKLWDRTTGAIDAEVAKTWERYDIRLVLENNWKTLAPKLAGKLHVWTGSADTFYLEGAVMRLEGVAGTAGQRRGRRDFSGRDHGLRDKAIRDRIAREMAERFRRTQPGAEADRAEASSVLLGRMRINTLVIVGVGLIGGSIALAARRRGVAARIVGVDRQPEALDRALRDGMLDEAHRALCRHAGDADLIVFCTPVDCIAAQVLEASRHCRPGTLLTDAGSTKAAIVRDVRGRLPAGIEFVGSHPLAGSEKHGPAHASAHLLEGRLVDRHAGSGYDVTTPCHESAISGRRWERACR